LRLFHQTLKFSASCFAFFSKGGAPVFFRRKAFDQLILLVHFELHLLHLVLKLLRSAPAVKGGSDSGNGGISDGFK
jgi:hypothetical protein